MLLPLATAVSDFDIVPASFAILRLIVDEYQQAKEEARRHGASTLDDYMLLREFCITPTNSQRSLA